MEDQYLNLLRFVLKHGEEKSNRTNVKTISYFGMQSRYDLQKGFPLLTTKKMALKSIIYELLWFLQGNTNIGYLVKHNVNIWNEWPFEEYRNSSAYQNESLSEFVTKIKTNDEFASKWGNLGPVYGKQWRAFSGVDQIKTLIKNLKEHPYSRRHIISAWNVPEIDKMLLPPCHLLMQFYVSNDNRLSCQLYQRSADLFLGVPFNIASYALLLMMIAQVCGFKLGEFVHTLGDAHIYVNHLEQVKRQLKRTPFLPPQMILNPNITDIFAFKFSDFSLQNYQYHPFIKAPIAV